jgi:hypothetical protein
VDLYDRPNGSLKVVSLRLRGIEDFHRVRATRNTLVGVYVRVCVCVKHYWTEHYRYTCINYDTRIHVHFVTA